MFGALRASGFLRVRGLALQAENSQSAAATTRRRIHSAAAGGSPACMYVCMHACMHVYMNKKQYTHTHKYTTYACICNMWCAPPMYPRLCSKSRLHGFRNARVIGLGSCLQIAPFFVIFKRSKTERIQPDFALHLELDLGFEAYSIECLLTPFEYAVLWFGNCILSRC